MAFGELGLRLEFTGSGIDEKGIISEIDEEKLISLLRAVEIEECDMLLQKARDLIDKVVVEVDPRYFRPTEVDILIGDATKAREKLGWQPKHTLDELVRDMIIGDMERNYREMVLRNCGFEVPKSCEL
jgi:GDPmannose 4,6-dehydratase